MLTEVDNFGQNPLQFCKNTLYMCYEQFFQTIQTIEELSNLKKNENINNSMSHIDKSYLSNQEGLIKHLKERINILKIPFLF